jgi:Ca2+-binding RTX toxin-like protein
MDILVIGQSNASNWFHDITFSASAPNTLSWRGGTWNPVRGEGAVAFTSTLASATGQQIRVLNAAEGNTSLTPVQGANWLATGPSTLYGKMLSAAAASGLKPDAIIWIQGERDAQFRVSTESYRAGLETLYQRLQQDFGDVPLLVQPLVLPQTGKDAIVAAQQAFAAAHHEHVALVTPSMELLTRDLLHFTPAGYNVLGDMMARAVLAELALPPAPSSNRIYAGAGDDAVNGTSGNDVLLGEQGNDHLLGRAGTDIISGGTGNDTIAGGSGADHLEGGPGADYFVFSGAADGADRIYDFAPGVDKLVFPSLAGVTASGNNVYHYGQLIVTAGGSIGSGDLISEAATPPPVPSAHLHGLGTSRSDTLTGGNGNDTLDGGAGRDLLAGGLGDDTYIVTSGDRISDTGGIDHVIADASWTLGAGLEHLTLTGTANLSANGNALNNRVVGNSGNNSISAGGGDDTLVASAGRDTLDGGAGMDTVDFGAFSTGVVVHLSALRNIEAAVGSNFADRITGSSAANHLRGGGGNDTLEGGGSSDTVVYAANGSQYMVLGTSAGTLAVGHRAGSDGADRLAGIEQLQFADGAMPAHQAVSVLQYTASYGDLIQIFRTSQDAALNHYLAYGYAEGRTLTFDALSYIASYVDLIEVFGPDARAGAVHFIDYGYDEDRRVDFEGLRYIASYGDLIQVYGANAAAGSEHFIVHGYREGRTTTFDAEQYLHNYPDLQAAFGHDVQAAARHFIEYGYYEGRTDADVTANSQVDFLIG